MHANPCRPISTATGPIPRSRARAFTWFTILSFAVLQFINVGSAQALPPANDAFTSATDIPLDGLPYTATQDSLDATTDTGGVPDPASVCGPSGFTVWYRLVTGGTGLTVTATTGGGDFFPPEVSVYRSTGNGLVPVGCGTTFGAPPLELAAGGTYYFMLSSFSGRPTFSFTVQTVVGPANDAFTSATDIPLDGLPYTATQDSLNATANTGGLPDPASVCGGASGFTVWYRLVTGGTGLTVTATTGGGDFFPPEVSVYRSTGDGLVPVGCGTAFGAPSVQLAAGGTYYFMLSSSSGRPTFSFTVQSVTPPANDSISSATVIDALPFTASQDTLTATSNTDGIPDPASICGGTGFTVWYRFTTTARSVTIAATAESPDLFPPLINIYRLDPSGLTPVGCATIGAVQLLRRSTYYIMLGSSTPRPAFTFTVRQVTPPANDSIRTATEIRTLPFTASQDTLTATSNTDGIPDPASICGGTGFTVWYTFTTTARSLTIAATANSPDFFPPLIDVYRLDSDRLTPVACASNGPVQLAPHHTYYFMLGSFTPRPTFTLTVQRT
jgi:hypothetical protein